MSKIDNFLDWIVDTKNFKEEHQIWKVPGIVIAAMGYFLIILWAVFNTITSLLILGILCYVLIILSALNWESKNLGRYKILRKKIF